MHDDTLHLGGVYRCSQIRFLDLDAIEFYWNEFRFQADVVAIEFTDYDGATSIQAKLQYPNTFHGCRIELELNRGRTRGMFWFTERHALQEDNRAAIIRLVDHQKLIHTEAQIVRWSTNQLELSATDLGPFTLQRNRDARWGDRLFDGTIADTRAILYI